MCSRIKIHTLSRFTLFLLPNWIVCVNQVSAHIASVLACDNWSNISFQSCLLYKIILLSELRHNAIGEAVRQNQQRTHSQERYLQVSFMPSIKVYHWGNHTVDLDISFSGLYTVNKSCHSLKHRGFSEKIYIGYTHIYNVHYLWREYRQNNFPLKLEFSVFYSHDGHLDVTRWRVINYCFTLTPNLFTGS